MIYEIEIKSPVKNENVLRLKLLEYGAVSEGVAEEIDIYFSHPSRDFTVSGESFRLRSSGQKACFTYKGPRETSKTKMREEIEFNIENHDKALLMIEKLSFMPVGIVKKKREKFRLDQYTISMDEVENAGRFVEIEVTSEDKIGGEKDVLDLALKLGLSDFENRSYFSIVNSIDN